MLTKLTYCGFTQKYKHRTRGRRYEAIFACESILLRADVKSLPDVKEKGFNVEDVIFNNNCNREMVEKVIESCLKIFVEKQKNLINIQSCK